MKNKFLLFVLLGVFAVLGVFYACSNESKSDISSPKGQASQDDSLNLLQKQIEATPQDATLYAKRAALYYDRVAYDDAINDWTKAIELDSTQAMYFHGLADAYLDNNKSRLALETMNKASNLFPKRIPTLLKLSEFQLILRKNQDAFRTMDRIMKVDPQNAEAFFMFGLNFKEVGDTTRAINSFQTAVENNPDLVDAWVELGNLLDQQGNPMATTYFDNALRVDPDNVLALEAKGNHLGGQQKFSEAINTYKKINAIQPQNPNAYYNIGLAYLKLDSISQAYQNFNISVEVDPVYVMGYFYRAYTAELKGDKTAAQKDYEQALRLSPEFERAKKAIERLGK